MALQFFCIVSTEIVLWRWRQSNATQASAWAVASCGVMHFLTNKKRNLSAMQTRKDLCGVAMTQAPWCDFLLLVLWVYAPLPYQIPAVRSSILSEQDVLLFVFRNRTHLKCKLSVLKVWFASFVFQICGWDMAPLSSCDCPHLDCVGEVTKEELIQKSHVSDVPSWPPSYGY